MRNPHLLILFLVIITPSEIMAQVRSQEIKPIYNGSRQSKRVALTIDDGWVDDPELLELLGRYEIPCTVFIPGRVAESRPEFVQDLARRGFEVANHTWSHRWLTRLSDDEIRQEFRKCQKILFDLTGQNHPYIRPPSGVWDQRVARIAAEEGFVLVLWDNDAMGYREDQTPEDQLRGLRRHKKNGNIILCHFGAKLNTAEVMGELIPEMLSEGYTFCTLTELLNYEENIEFAVRRRITGIVLSENTSPLRWQGILPRHTESIRELIKEHY